MRRKRLFFLILVAGISGLAAASIAMDYIESSRTPVIAPQRRNTQVAVAVRDLPLGERVKPEDVRLVEWPGDQVPAGYFGTVEDVVGRGLIRPVATNEPFLAAKLAEPGGRVAGMPLVIPEGMRALSVRVDEVIGVAGWAVPETRVDVLVTVSPPGNNREKISRVILQNITVLGAGQAIEQTEEGKPMQVTVITLLVTPEQAETLTLAANEGRIQLALRGMLDTEEITTRGTQVASLIGPVGGRRPTGRRIVRSTPGAQTDQSTVVEMFKGGVRTLTTFNNE